MWMCGGSRALHLTECPLPTNCSAQTHSEVERRVITVSQLTKLYGHVVAVDRVSFDVPKGQIVGFLGPNGAGKSTTLRMLTCYLPPTSGGATVNGFDIFHQSADVR